MPALGGHPRVVCDCSQRWVDDGGRIGGRARGDLLRALRVPLVSVEVVATDKDGVPIRGLTRDDFQVFEDNVEVEISHFFVSDPELAQNDPVAYQEDLPENFRQNLYLALYFDDTSIDFERRMSALQHLRGFLEQPLPQNVQAMLVRYDGSIHVEQGFTDQTDELVPAVERVMAEPAVDDGR